MSNESEKTCLMPECTDANVKLRGLCTGCYQSASRLIRMGKTTWQELEERGQALPANQGRPGTPAHRAIMGNTETQTQQS